MIDPELLKKADQIREIRDRIKKHSQSGKILFEKEWYRNILFFLGRQWIVYDKRSRSWRDAPLEKWYPRPVTNKFRATANTLKAILKQKTPRILVKPASDSPEDIATAQVVDEMSEILDAESHMDTQRDIAAGWKVLTGNVFYQNLYEVGKEIGEIFVPHTRCNTCSEVMPADAINEGKCPCGSGDLGMAVGPDGMPMGQMVPQGEMRVEAFSGFEMFCNQEIENFEDVKELVRSKRVAVQDLKEIYSDIADKIVPSQDGQNRGASYLRSLAYATGSAGTEALFLSDRSGPGGSNEAPATSVDYLYCLPTKEFPQGIVATLIQSEFAELSTMDEVCKTVQGKYFLPFVHDPAIRVPGRLWGASTMDDLITLQLDRNKAQSYIEMGLYTMANPIWLEPEGANMDNPTGEPGQRVKYNALPGGAKPERVQGKEVPISSFKVVEMADKAFEDIGRTFDVLKGQLPSGLDTFSGLRLLTEQAFSNHIENLQGWDKSMVKIKIQQLEIARLRYIEPRKKTFQNEFGSWETKQFTKADLQGGVDIRIEEGSTLPKSKAVQDSTMLESIKIGLINVGDPAVRSKVLETLGQSKFGGALTIDTKDAMHEWQIFVETVESISNPSAWAAAIRPREGIDNEQLHLLDAVNRCKSEKFFALPPQAQQLWVEHTMYHKMNLEKAAAQAAQAQMPSPSPSNAGRGRAVTTATPSEAPR